MGNKSKALHSTIQTKSNNSKPDTGVIFIELITGLWTGAEAHIKWTDKFHSNLPNKDSTFDKLSIG